MILTRKIYVDSPHSENEKKPQCDCGTEFGAGVFFGDCLRVGAGAETSIHLRIPSNARLQTSKCSGMPAAGWVVQVPS